MTTYTMRPCTCIADKEMTCIVHPTTRSLKDLIAQLEAENAKLREFLADMHDKGVCECNQVYGDCWHCLIGEALLEEKNDETS